MSIAQSDRSDDLNARIAAIKDHFTYSIYRNVRTIVYFFITIISLFFVTSISRNAGEVSSLF